jgi:hypothetical protein
LLELPHRGKEGGFELHTISVGEEQDGPETVGEFVRERDVEIFGGTKAFLGHDELHQIADVADETLGEFGRPPRARAGGEGLRVVKRTNFFGAGSEPRKRLRGLGHRFISRGWR